jgi:hypothetical protein
VSHSQEAAPGFGMYGGGAGAGVGFQVSGMRASSGTGSYAPLGAVAASMDVNQVQDAVLKEFQKCEDSTGLSIRTVITALKGRISQEQVKDAVSFLTTEGHLYSTIDDEVSPLVLFPSWLCALTQPAPPPECPQHFKSTA